MTELNRAGENQSLGDLNTTQGQFRDQIDVVADELRQLAGNADIPDDPLNAPYILYVSSYIGNDTYISGDYKSTGDLDRRISLQRLEAGYTEARPFRTINRAIIEAGIITSRSWFTTDAQRKRALVSIVILPGEQTILNGLGSNAGMTTWADGTVPTDAQLTAFNPTEGGVILPRGCSLVSMDLRKTLLRPAYVPAEADEAADYSNRSCIFRMTGQGYYYGLTFKDQLDSTSSHHLLSCFEYTSEGQLTDFYRKIDEISVDVNAANAEPRDPEYQIVGPQPENPTIATDTVNGASPYIYNISIRSTLGLCGVFANGAAVEGFMSCVIAQFTGVSLQTDLSCWQQYISGTWSGVATYANLINTDPDDIRANPNRRSFHIRAINDAVIQEVSVFAIGQAIHHWTESGGSLTITNSNSNFGGCAALSEGFKAAAAPKDTDWNTAFVRRAVNPFTKDGNIRQVTIGRLVDTQSNTSATLTLDADFTPEALEREGYSLKENDYIWVDNPGGADYRAQLAATPWSDANPERINIQSQVETDDADGNVNPSDPGVDNNEYQSIESKRVYIRRLLDVRSVDERRYSIILQGQPNSNQRVPVKEYIVQPETGSWNERVLAVNASETTTDVSDGVNVEFKTADRPEAETNFDSAKYYRPGDTIRRDNKHWTAGEVVYGSFDVTQWTQAYVHMQEDYAAPDFYKSAQPLIVFDGDTDQSESSDDMGFTLNTAVVEAQYESATDYQGAFNYLRNLGNSVAQAEALLIPQAEASRNSSISGAVEFRSPSTIRMFGHAYEWAGYLNYTKALPQYQGDLSRVNKFTYYFTNEGGGKVFASGFNEEGYLVSNRGIEEVESGKVIGFENIGNSDIQIDIPELPVASQAQAGIVELATTAEVDALERDDRAVTPASLSNFANRNTTPVGAVMMYAGSAPPTGWLECNGAAIAGAYTQLRALVGANTPDLRGEFVRGWDHGRGVDSGRGIRSTQAGTNASHNHGLSGGGASGNFLTSASLNDQTREVPNTPDEVNVLSDSTSLSTSSGSVSYSQPSVQNDGGNESRPRNLALMFIIKHD